MAVAFRDTSLPITMAGKNYVMKYLDFFVQQIAYKS